MIIEAGTLTEVISKNAEKKNVQGAAAGFEHTESVNTERAFFQESVEAQNTVNGDATYGRPGQEQGSAKEEIQEAFGNLDAKQRKDQMAVLSNTTTVEDYQAMQEDGFSMESTDSTSIVTEMDKIKMKLAEAGEDISCYGDLPDKDKLEEVLGNTALAEHVAAQMQQKDVPVTEENLQGIQGASEMAETLTEPSEGAMRYMLDNQLPPTIANLYTAEHSGSTATTVEEAAAADFTDLEGQINKVIAAAGLDATPSVTADAKWMLQNGIPLTAENLNYVEDLKNISFPVEAEQAADSMVEALSEGKTAMDGLLAEGYTLQQQAREAVEIITNATEEDLRYVVENNQELTIENLKQAENQRLQNEANPQAPTVDQAQTVDQSQTAKQAPTVDQSAVDIAMVTARRQLEETRLLMTANASYALLKQGIEIDTKPLEELVDQLKQVEDRYYSQLLLQSGVEASDENIALFKQTDQSVELLKMAPCYALGAEKIATAGQSGTEDTVNNLLERGTVLKDALDKANQSYETMMTTPRKDLGDSITKAFRNVDDILTDLGLDTTEANQRAVRILGYNGLEINEESITRMKAADQQVQMAFKNMTPAVVTEFIRRGINPLDMDINELNAQASNIKEELGDTSEEKFSRYLYDLEKNDAITQEERESYMGVFRLINQVEKNDGAAIGALVNQGAEVTMRNLMMAVRSARKENSEYTVDDNTGAAESVNTMGNSITEQIETSYQAGCLKESVDLLSPENWKTVTAQADWENMTPEQFQEALQQAQEEQTQETSSEYAKSQLELLNQAAKAPEQVYQLLNHYNIPNTVNNVLAASNMLNKRNVFNQLFEETPDSEEIDMEALKEETLRQFSDAMETPEDMAEAQKALADTAENVMKTIILSDDVSTIDIRQMKLVTSQLQIAEKMAREEQYAIPVMVGDEVTNLTLKIVRGKEEKGKVDIMFETPALGKVAAEISAAGKVLQGYIAAESKETQEKLQENSQQLEEAIGDGEELKLSYLTSKNLDLNSFGGTSEAAQEGEAEQTQEQREVQTTTLYGIAERFLNAIKAIDLKQA